MNAPSEHFKTVQEEIERLAEKNFALLGRITEFDLCIQQIAAELGSPVSCHGGVVGDQSDPRSTTAVLVEAIRKLKPPVNNELLFKALGKIVDRIEACGASLELTHAVTLASDLRQAVGNQHNHANPYALIRVVEATND